MSPHLRGVTITGLGVLIVSPDALVARMVELDTWSLLFWRAGFQCLGMLVLLGILYRVGYAREGLGARKPLLAFATLQGVGMIAFIYAITHTSAANTLLILSTTPLFAALVSWVILREALSLRTWLAIALVAIGIGVISSAESDGINSLQGDLAALLGSFTLGCSFTIARKFKNRSPLPGIALGSLIVAGAMATIGNPLSISTADFFYLFVMAAILLPAGIAAMLYGPRFVPSAEVGLLMLLESILGPLWVWLVMAEAPSSQTFVGGAIILFALAMNLALALRTETDRKV